MFRYFKSAFTKWTSFRHCNQPVGKSPLSIGINRVNLSVKEQLFMGTFDRKQHWETIYQTKPLTDVSWYQPTPETSLQFVRELAIPKDAKIIDIGGGDSFLVDHLLALGYSDVTVLDISEAAIARAKQRLGVGAEKVTWIVADASTFQPTETYDLWHDRAAFHFLTDPLEIEQYVKTATENIRINGSLVIGTFSTDGPLKCSGIPIQQYTPDLLQEQFSEGFECIQCFTQDHPTPFDTLQNFVFCRFRKKE